MGFPVSFGSENDTYADFSTGPVIIALFDKHEMSEAMGAAHLPPQASAQDKLCLVFAVEDVNLARPREPAGRRAVLGGDARF